MKFRLKARNLRGRLATGVFILPSGLEKWHGDSEHAAATHGMAAGAFPVLKQLPLARLFRLLAAYEIGVGAALLLRTVSHAVAGSAITSFSGTLVAM